MSEQPEEPTVVEIARAIVAGHAFTDSDAVRVAAAFLQLREETSE